MASITSGAAGPPASALGSPSPATSGMVASVPAASGANCGAAPCSAGVAVGRAAEASACIWVESGVVVEGGAAAAAAAGGRAVEEALTATSEAEEAGGGGAATSPAESPTLACACTAWPGATCAGHDEESRR